MNRQVFLLILMVIFCPLAVDIYLPGIPQIASDFSVSAEMVQWSLGLFLFSVGMGQLVFGPLCDRVGRRPVALMGGVIYILAAILSVLASDLMTFLIARMLQGVGACAIMVVAFAFVRDRYDVRGSGMIFSYLNGVICCVPALAPLLGEALLQWYGWRSHFVLLSLYGAGAIALIALCLPETRPANTQVTPVRGVFKAYMDILRHPRFLFHALVVMLSMAVIITYVTHAPVWIIVNLEQSSQVFIFWFGLNAVVNIAAYLVTPSLLKRFGPKVMTHWGIVVVSASGVLMLGLLGHQTTWAFMSPVLLSSVGIAMTLGASSGQALSPFGEKAATASALLGFMQMCGAAVIVFLVQVLPLDQMEQLAVVMLCFVLLWAHLTFRAHTTQLFAQS